MLCVFFILRLQQVRELGKNKRLIHLHRSKNVFIPNKKKVSTIFFVAIEQLASCKKKTTIHSCSANLNSSKYY